MHRLTFLFRGSRETISAGEQAVNFDQATVDADVAHAEQILEEKYQARKAQGLE